MQTFVLTGGPGAGKSTVIAELERRGYATLPEMARILIEHHSAAESDLLPWKNNQAFQNLVIQDHLAQEAQAQEPILFLDRTHIDAVAYLAMNNIPVPAITRGAREPYTAVFMLELIPDIIPDDTRHESRKTALIIERVIFDMYKHCGYEPIRIPLCSPQDRAEMILEGIKKSATNL